MSLKYKFLFTLLSVAFIPFLFIGLLNYSTARQLLTEEAVAKLNAIKNLKVKQFEDNLLHDKEKLRLVTSRTQLRQLVDTYNKSKNPEDLKKLNKILVDAKQTTTNFLSISILDTTGQIVVSTDPNSIGADQSNQSFFLKGKERDSADTFKQENNRLVHYLSGPLFLDNKLIGVLTIRTDARHYLSLFSDYSELGKSGEAIFVIRQDNYAFFTHPTRFDKLAAFQRKIDLDDFTKPVSRALTGKSGTFSDTKDYRNIPVLSATHYFKNLDAALVIKIDKDEALRPINSFQTSFIVVSFSVLLFVLLIVLSTTRTFVKPIIELKDSVEKLSRSDFTTTVTIDTYSKDELGLLAGAFRTMAAKLKQSYSGLEQKVRDRTQDLQKFKLAVDDASDHITITDADGVIIYANPAVERLTGFSKEEVIGKKAGSKELWGGLMTREFYSKLWQRIKIDKKPFRGEIKNKRKNGEMFITQANIFPILDNRGEVVFFVEIHHDITKEKAIDKAKTEFVSLASHQLRTPLSTISWYAEMLLSGDAGKISDKQKKYLQEVYVGNKRMLDLVNALLNVSKIDMGTINIEPVLSDIIALSKDVVKEQKLEIFNKKLKLIEKYGSDIPKINLDPKLIRIVLQNLLSNAIRYTPKKGTIELSITKDEENLLISVADTGYGIPNKQQNKIFTKLFRADNIKNKDTVGTGLGLYIVKAIVKESRGTIRFESEENKGTTFYVTLPISGMQVKTGKKQRN